MNWGTEDFLAAGLILGVVGGAFWMAMRQSERIAYRMAFALGLGAVVMLIWVALAVGIIGDEGNPANLVFAIVVLVAITGVAASRFEARNLSKAMWFTAGFQAFAGVVAISLTGSTQGAPGLPFVLGFNLVLLFAFAVSALLFQVEDGGRHINSR